MCITIKTLVKHYLDGSYLVFNNTPQWGVYIKVPSKYTFTYPTEFKSTSFVVIPIDLNVENNPIIFGVDNLTKNNATIAGRRTTEVTELWFRYIAIGF